VNSAPANPARIRTEIGVWRVQKNNLASSLRPHSQVVGRHSRLSLSFTTRRGERRTPSTSGRFGILPETPPFVGGIEVVSRGRNVNREILPLVPGSYIALSDSTHSRHASAAGCVKAAATISNNTTMISAALPSNTISLSRSGFIRSSRSISVLQLCLD
jgi:hypothetical protein